MNIYNSLMEQLIKKFPVLKGRQDLIAPTLISNAKVKIEPKTYDWIQKGCQAFFDLRQSERYQSYVMERIPEDLRFDPKNYSLFMSFDYHIDVNGVPKLIEINTNAAASLLSYELQKLQGLEGVNSSDFYTLLKSAFEEEFRLSGMQGRQIAIVDEDLKNQNMYFEMLMFKSLFEQWGWSCEICEPHDLEFSKGNLRFKSDGKPIDMVYNRWTDFLLRSESAKDLLCAFIERKVCLSPNPHEYLLLADKERSFDFLKEDKWDLWGLSSESRDTLKQIIPRTYKVSDFEKEDLWAQRKKFFFKPQRSHGGKAAYKGASMTKKVFEQVCAGEFVAQEFVPAPKVEAAWIDPEGKEHKEAFKYDLRFYFYKDEIQLAVARLFQGQLTNFKTLGGGFAPVFIDS